MKARGKLAVAIIVVALACGLAPGLAFAANGNDAQTDATPAVEQTPKLLATSSSALQTQSDLLYISSPSSSDTFIVGDTVNVKAYTGIYIFQYGYAVSNFLTFKVTYKGETVFYGSDYYNSLNDPCGISFTPEKPGKYKIYMSGSRFSEVSEDDFEATDTVTITVKDQSSIIKTVEPGYPSVKRYKKSRVKITVDTEFTGAYIYRATPSTGKFKLIGTTTKSSFIDKVDKNTDYFYKIRFFYKKGSKIALSKYSPIADAFVNEPATPVIKKVKKVSKGVKINWKFKGECTGMFILRATKKNGEYEFIDGFDGKAGRRVYIDKSAKPGKTYWYKVEVKNWLDWKDEGAFKESEPVKIKA